MSTNIDLTVLSLDELNELKREIPLYINTIESRERKKYLNDINIGDIYKSVDGEYATYYYKILDKIGTVEHEDFCEDDMCLLVECFGYSTSQRNYICLNTFNCDYHRFKRMEKVNIDFQALRDVYINVVNNTNAVYDNALKQISKIV